MNSAVCLFLEFIYINHCLDYTDDTCKLYIDIILIFGCFKFRLLDDCCLYINSTISDDYISSIVWSLINCELRVISYLMRTVDLCGFVSDGGGDLVYCMYCTYSTYRYCVQYIYVPTRPFHHDYK